jgi:hypothetical protein
VAVNVIEDDDKDDNDDDDEEEGNMSAINLVTSATAASATTTTSASTSATTSGVPAIKKPLNLLGGQSSFFDKPAKAPVVVVRLLRVNLLCVFTLH